MILYLSFPDLNIMSMKRNPTLRSKNTKLFHNIQKSDHEIDLNIFFRDSSLRVNGWDDMSECGVFTLYVSSGDDSATCPYCGHLSKKVHSRYLRRLRDLPAFGKAMDICFHARKFFCDNQECRYKTFAEQPGSEIFRYRRRTRRCEVLVHRHGLQMSSIQSSGLLKSMGVRVSKSTVLRDLHRMRVPDEKDIRRIGIDDWAFRKGSDYGSIIVNLATGRPMDMLSSRTEKEFSEWLGKHRKVWLLSRDRATAYSGAAASCGLSITEIADRFHLMKNLGECVTDTISSRYESITKLFASEVKSGDLLAQDTASPRKRYAEERLKEIRRLLEEGKSIAKIMRLLRMSRRTVNKYLAMDPENIPDGKTAKKYVYENRFNEVKRLQKEGKSVSETVSILGMTWKTVVKYRESDSFPVPIRKSVSKCRNHKEFVEEKYARGTSMDEIHKILVQKGEKIERSSFYEYFSYLSDGHRGYRPTIEKERMEEKWQQGLRPADYGSHILLPPVRQIASTVMKGVLDKDLSKSESELMESLRKLEWFVELYEAAVSFRKNLHSGCPSLMDTWLERYKITDNSRLQTFIKGLKMDIKAVKNAVLFNESNGIVEGYVNKLKTLKRSMYGKAKLPLLKVKMIMPAWIFN